jgi:ADP-ribose pyrophosphatase YjhB (NUDIX family)
MCVLETTPRSYDVRIVLLTLDGIPLVKRMHHQKGSLWRFPGGGGKAKDRGDFRETARRELMGEVGVNIKPDTFELVSTYLIQEKMHMKYLVLGRCRRHLIVPEKNNEGEWVKLFTQEEIATLVERGEFVQEHLELLKRGSEAYRQLILPGI